MTKNKESGISRLKLLIDNWFIVKNSQKFEHKNICYTRKENH